jgi:hypothetical protein
VFYSMEPVQVAVIASADRSAPLFVAISVRFISRVSPHWARSFITAIALDAAHLSVVYWTWSVVDVRSRKLSYVR